MNYFERVIQRINNSENNLRRTLDGYIVESFKLSEGINNDLKVYGDHVAFKGILIPLTPKQVEDIHIICDASFEKRQYLIRESILKEL